MKFTVTVAVLCALLLPLATGQSSLRAFGHFTSKDGKRVNDKTKMMPRNQRFRQFLEKQEENSAIRKRSNTVPSVYDDIQKFLYFK